MIDFQTLLIAVMLVGLVVTASFIVLIPDWRLAFFALLVQYFIAAVLLAELLPWQIALVRVISGALALTVLFFTLRHKAQAYRRARRRAATDDNALAVAERLARRQVFIVGFPFRFFALALIAVGNIGIASSMTFLGLPPDILFSGMWLMSTGILVAILSRDVPRLGLGILMFTSGLAVLETGTEASLLLYGLLNISDLLLALVIAHLSALPAPDLGAQRRHGEAE